MGWESLWSLCESEQEGRWSQGQWKAGASRPTPGLGGDLFDQNQFFKVLPSVSYGPICKLTYSTTSFGWSWKSGPRPAKSLFSIFGQNRPFAWISYILTNAALEPKIFVFKSSHQKQCRKAHNIGHFCQKDQTSISPRSKVRNRAKLTFQLAPKWQKVANWWILQIWLFSTLSSPQTTRRERFDVHWKSFSWIPYLPIFCRCG